MAKRSCASQRVNGDGCHGLSAIPKGGTAALYQHVLQHPSSTSLTPMSIFYMLLLAVHYALQPRLSKKYIAKSVSTTSVALVEEITKASLAGVLLLTTASRQKWMPVVSQVANVLTDKTAAVSLLSSSLVVAGLPAALYALQNVLQYVSHQKLDAIAFNGLSQTKTLSAALWCYLLLNKSQSLRQMLALSVLFFSALLFQRDNDATVKSNSSKTTKTNDAATAAGATTKIRQERFWLGVLPCATATLLSGLAGALSQKGVQATGSFGRNAYVYAMEVSLYSALTLAVSRAVIAATKRQSRKRKHVGPQQMKQTSTAFFDGWTYQTWYPVVSKALGGVLTVLVHKHTGAVSKGFALMFGLVLAGVIESLMGGEKGRGKPMPWAHVLGTLLVMLSGWMHLTQTTV
ncbi:hypothetical protein MPSEU_000417300 [Mayamaea pseudoterrestris]|nr:hypothetical protein MPSEU_000417300 [Mayamaea pseudoterrestris]